jgi:hypothetical protein
MTNSHSAIADGVADTADLLPLTSTVAEYIPDRRHFEQSLEKQDGSDWVQPSFLP